MTYDEWMKIVAELKDIYERVHQAQRTELTSHTVHAAMMAADQARWIDTKIVDMMYSSLSATAKHEAAS